MPYYELSARYQAQYAARQKKATRKNKYGIIQHNHPTEAIRPIYAIQEKRLKHFDRDGSVGELILLYLRDRNRHSAQ